MLRKSLILSFFFLSGCAQRMGSYYPDTYLNEPAKGMAQFVIYHPNEIIGSVNIGSGPDVEINEKFACGLPTGGFFVASVNSGEVSISSTKFMAVGTSILNLRTNKNQRYFIRITWNNNKVILGAIGEAISEGYSYRNGPFIIESVEEKTAKSELQSLKMVNCSI